jgi:osmoprotectant transport system substrate-binding protein
MRRYRTLALGAAALVLVLSACTPGGSEASPSGSAAAAKPNVSVGSAGFWESAVVAEMYAQALEASGYPVERHLEIGERPALLSAFEAGEVNLVPEYLGGLAGQGLELEERPSDPEAAWDNLQGPLDEKGWIIFDFSPGTDADGFAVRSETADELGLATMSDLTAVADQLTWGLAEGCPTNPVCGPGLNETYGIDISQLDVVTLPSCSADMATALSDEAIDVAQVCTTQPEIVTMNLVVLEDDMHLQPAQNMVPLAHKDLVVAAPADFAETLNAIHATLTTEALIELGVAINVNQDSIQDVARQFLEDQGLLP